MAKVRKARPSMPATRAPATDGTAVTIMVPLAAALSKAPQAPASSCNLVVKIILADDHSMVREALRVILERDPDVRVLGEADNGRELLDLVRQLSPDLVVMDIAMPELNGLEACARLTARYPEVKVVVLSAYADKRYVLEALKAGAAGYVSKAAAGTELLRAVRTVMSGENYLCPEVASAVIGDLRGEKPRTGPAGPLGRREREVLQLLAEGHRSADISARMHISVATVEAHRRNIMRKLDLHTVAELTKYAIREGLTLP